LTFNITEPSTIFLTGGTGFLGRHLVPALCRAGHTVRVLTRFPDTHTWLKGYPRIEVIHGDVLNANSYSEAMRGCRYVIHAAGVFRFWGEEQLFHQTNVQGTQRLLAIAGQAQVERFIYVSTVAVIGQPNPADTIDENYPAKPTDPYQQSKLQAEQIVQQYHHDYHLPVMILRPGAFYGPLGEYAFNRLFFRDPMRGLIMQINGGRHIIFPVYIADVAQGIIKALDRGCPGEIYNICGDWISHKQAFDIICQEANLPWPRLPIPGWLGIATARVLTAISNLTGREPFWPINLRSYVYNDWRVSSDKARRELGFMPLDFREGARRTIAWYKAGKPNDIPEVKC
jgi:dihydroflavonol-4-reductase